MTAATSPFVGVHATLELRRHSIAETGGDLRLTPAGIALAEELGRTLPPFDLVLASPELRARQTASLVGGRVDHVLDALRPADLELASAEIDPPFTWGKFTSPNQETTGIAERVLNAVNAVRGDIGRHRRVLAITHDGVVQSAATWISPHVDFPEDRRIDNCEGVLIDLTQALVVDRLDIDRNG